MRSGRAKIKVFHDDDTNPSSDREESFNNEESKDEKKDMSSSPINDTSTTANKAKGRDLNVNKLDDAATKGMCIDILYDVCV